MLSETAPEFPSQFQLTKPTSTTVLVPRKHLMVLRFPALHACSTTIEQGPRSDAAMYISRLVMHKLVTPSNAFIH